ncbi:MULTISPECIES: chemotaxis response regulator protein-glutamate methylesterase [unclassified Motilimonas]|uniref:protein-glutamate methylesterase/protein-glutamine glutaminase n=1 Tax=Motilimonas TaxID=1914248 RepID=UPI001E303E4D|nr:MULTISPECIES: chemotaxis response regulator protein-glutamate methylesterase [unclassified Motilimonas]MCE0555877.1 chemotaxis response regulator protein-glutamate methylesterase [Motilimonas sp. E26]MDO6524075.1 chemotaxis response regulator protein-glutamate methylesterase [Motilimonas sp. 1_MG-2023]
MTEKIKVLVVDDSALIRSLLGEIVRSEPDFLLVGVAPDAYIAKDMVNTHSPDVITLDVEMPKVDGLTFLDRLMKARPTPVLMVSSLTEQGADVTLKALELGAVDFFPKPKLDIAKGIEDYRSEIVAKIRSVASAKLQRRPPTLSPSAYTFKFKTTEKVIAIGASTGGTEALKSLLSEMPVDSPAIVITQHMPPGFTKTFAERLDTHCAISVKEAQDGERLLPGCAYLAKGDLHLLVIRSGADYRIKFDDGERISGHKPSVDVMLKSVARAVGQNALGVILTGMGKDGAAGMLEIAQAGGITIAQDEASSVIFGMPKAAIEMGGVQMILGLQNIPAQIVKSMNHLGTEYRV